MRGHYGKARGERLHAGLRFTRITVKEASAMGRKTPKYSKVDSDTPYKLVPL